MSDRVLILRPQTGADATATKARAHGLTPLVMPLFEIRPIAWSPPDAAAFDALALTSANAVLHAGAALSHYLPLPVYAVGAATARSARDAGFSTVHVGDGDAAQLVAMMHAAGVRRALHLVGRDHVRSTHPEIEIVACLVYAAEAVDPPPALPAANVILVHSVRAAQRLAAITPPDARPRYRVAALSAAVAAALGENWGLIRISPVPSDDALLACAAKLCKAM